MATDAIEEYNEQYNRHAENQNECPHPPESLWEDFTSNTSLVLRGCSDCGRTQVIRVKANGKEELVEQRVNPHLPL